MTTSALVRIVRSIKRGEKQIITPRITKWLNDNPQGVKIETQEEADLVVKLLSDKSNDQRGGRFGASSRGSCMRAQVFQFLDLPARQWINYQLRNTFNDGHWRHVRWQLMGLKAGVFTHVEVPAAIPSWHLLTSMDALNDQERFLFELKGTGLFHKAMDGPPDQHLRQIHTYFVTTGYDVCSYVQEDKRHNDWHEVVVRKDPLMIREVKKELNLLNESVTERILPPVLTECRAKKGAYKNCPYSHRCLGNASQGDPWPDNGTWPGH